MKKRVCLIALLLFALSLQAADRSVETMEQLTKRVFVLAQKQYVAMAETLGEGQMPRTTEDGTTLITSDINWWCSGFYPGSLWYIYQYSGDENIRLLADRYTRMLEPLKNCKSNHDVGFQLNCSYGNAYRLTADSSYIEPMVTGAHSLATRFNPVVGCTRSWDFSRKGRNWLFPVIIDNMMNMELLLNVGSITSDQQLIDMANSHAKTTMKNHFRDDYSTFHLVDYDPSTGEVRARNAVQGYADSSMWARGEAWAFYGFTMMYRMTSDPKYLAQAEQIAKLLLKRLPEDGIPYWDFDDPAIPNALRDASAGSIMASAFVSLGSLSFDNELAVQCLDMARKQLRTLASDSYLALEGDNCHFLLRHSVGSLPDNGEVDVPLTYADYYFLEALINYPATAAKVGR